MIPFVTFQAAECNIVNNLLLYYDTVLKICTKNKFIIKPILYVWNLFAELF